SEGNRPGDAGRISARQRMSLPPAGASLRARRQQVLGARFRCPVRSRGGGMPAMEITILVESTDPLTGRVVASTNDQSDDQSDDRPDDAMTDIGYMGWLGLLRALDDLICPSTNPPRSVE